MAGERDAVSLECALEIADACRDLPRPQLPLAEAPRPIGRQYAMRRSGRRVLVDAVVRREIARDEIDAAITRCSDNGVRSRHLAHCSEIGPKRRHVRSALIDGQSAAARDKALHWCGAECGEDP